MTLLYPHLIPIGTPLARDQPREGGILGMQLSNSSLNQVWLWLPNGTWKSFAAPELISVTIVHARDFQIWFKKPFCELLVVIVIGLVIGDQMFCERFRIICSWWRCVIVLVSFDSKTHWPKTV